jgi:outer membrane protein TolC
LVRADQRPAADLRQVEGNLADRQRQLTQAHASAFEAQRLLALSMGLSPEEMDAVPGLANELPVKPADVAQVLATNDLATAFEQRKDLSSAQQIESATRVRKDAAAGNRLPALDLSVGAFYSGLSDEGGEGGYFGSLVHSPAGPNLNASLSLELPVLNKQRQGGYQARAAEHEIADLAVLEQRRQIAARVGIARNNLERAVQALDVADRAAELYLQALDDEREKLRAGLATVIDVVFVQDRLLQIQLNQLNAHLRYAAALAQYRFELGDLPETPQDADERRLAPVLGPSS